MKLLFDLFPVILFFATYKFFSHGEGGNACMPDQAIQLPWTQEPILIATVVAIIATFVQVAWVKYRHGKVDAILWVSFAIIVVFGGATLYFHNPLFIQWKPSVLYWLFSAILLFSSIFFKKNLIRSLLQEKIALPLHVWHRLNWVWALFFFLLGFINVAAIHLLSCNNWVNFKLFGFTALMAVFILAQSAWLAKYVDEKKESN